MNENTKASLLALLGKEAKEAGENLAEAQRIEQEGGFSDAMISMDRTYAEGFSDALEMAIRLIEEVK